MLLQIWVGGDAGEGVLCRMAAPKHTRSLVRLSAWAISVSIPDRTEVGGQGIPICRDLDGGRGMVSADGRTFLSGIGPSL